VARVLTRFTTPFEDSGRATPPKKRKSYSAQRYSYSYSYSKRRCLEYEYEYEYEVEWVVGGTCSFGALRAYIIPSSKALLIFISSTHSCRTICLLYERTPRLYFENSSRPRGISTELVIFVGALAGNEVARWLAAC